MSAHAKVRIPASAFQGKTHWRRSDGTTTSRASLRHQRTRTGWTHRGNNIKARGASPTTNADRDQQHLSGRQRWEKMSSCTKAVRRLLPPSRPSPPTPPPRTGGGFLHQKNSWQINALPLGLIKLEGIKTTEQLLWWTQCCASCALCSEGNFCHLASALPAAPRWTRSNTVNFL